MIEIVADLFIFILLLILAIVLCLWFESAPFRYEFNKRREKFVCWLAFKTPKWLARACYIRVVANHGSAPDTYDFSETLKLFDEGKRGGLR